VFLDLRAPAEWCREYGIRILAWDGWRDPDPLDINGPLGQTGSRRTSPNAGPHASPP
jgi:hypothetical protein